MKGSQSALREVVRAQMGRERRESVLGVQAISHLLGVIIRFCLVLSCAPAPAEAQAPELKATASGTMTNAFIADENNLRKLAELIRKRMAEQAAAFKMKFTVTFSDNSYYDTYNADLIYKEENPRTRRIVALAIVARQRSRTTPGASREDIDDITEPEIQVKLESESLGYSVKGANRDWVLNTQSDIRERFSNMASHYTGGKFVVAFVFGAIGVLGTFVPGAGWWRNRYDRKIREGDANHQRTRLTAYIFGRVKDPDFGGTKAGLYFNSVALAGVVLGIGGYRLGEYLFPGEALRLSRRTVNRNRYMNLRRLNALTCSAVSSNHSPFLR